MQPCAALAAPSDRLHNFATPPYLADLHMRMYAQPGALMFVAIGANPKQPMSWRPAAAAVEAPFHVRLASTSHPRFPAAGLASVRESTCVA